MREYNFLKNMYYFQHKHEEIVFLVLASYFAVYLIEINEMEMKLLKKL